MAAILNGLRALGSGRVLDEVLTLVMDSALEVTKAERGFMMLAGRTASSSSRSRAASGTHDLPGTSFTTSEKIPREVFQTGQSRTVGDLMEGDWPGSTTARSPSASATCCACRCCVSPMSRSIGTVLDRQNDVIGVLYLDGRERARCCPRRRASSLEAFATQAALAIESARLYAESAEKAKHRSRSPRRRGHPARAAAGAGVRAGIVDLAAASIPCRTVGGDFYDYLDVGERGFGFALGDVAGKGPPAALLAAAVQSNFVALAPVSATRPRRWSGQ